MPRITIAEHLDLTATAEAAKRETKEARAELEIVRAALDERGKRVAELEARLKTYEERGKALRDATDDLKDRLATAYEHIARLDGYIARALEDDAVRECSPQSSIVSTPEPRRRGPGDMPADLPNLGHDDTEDRYGRTQVAYRVRRKPWHSL